MKKLNVFIFFAGVLGIGFLQTDCYFDKETDRQIAVCDTVAVSYSAQVAPILAAKCYDCHSEANNVAQSPFDTYATLQDYIDEALVASLKGTGGYNIMPPSGALSACDISKIEAWVKAGAPNN